MLEEKYQMNAIKLAKWLLGKNLVRKTKNTKFIGKIVETESYLGPKDKACHAYNNKKTKRTKVMFKKGGYSYVYLIYGMYHCFNIVAGEVNQPQAVLIRALEPISEIDKMKDNRQIKNPNLKNLTNGPGKLCQAMQIDKELNDYDLTKKGKIYIEETNIDLQDSQIQSTPRVNIDYAQEYKNKKRRFIIKNNPFVSKI